MNNTTKLLNNTFIAEYFEKESLSTLKKFLKDKFNIMDLFDKSAKYWT